MDSWSARRIVDICYWFLIAVVNRWLCMIVVLLDVRPRLYLYEHVHPSFGLSPLSYSQSYARTLILQSSCIPCVRISILGCCKISIWTINVDITVNTTDKINALRSQGVVTILYPHHNRLGCILVSQTLSLTTVGADTPLEQRSLHYNFAFSRTSIMSSDSPS